MYLLPGLHPDITDAPGNHLAALYMEAHSLTGAGILLVGELTWTWGTIAMDLSVEAAGFITGEVTDPQGPTPLATTLINSGAMAMGPGITFHLDMGTKIENLGTWTASRVGGDTRSNRTSAVRNRLCSKTRGTSTQPAPRSSW